MNRVEDLTFKDLFGDPLKRGDYVIYIEHSRCKTYLIKRVVTDFTKSFVVLDEGHRVVPHNVFITDDKRFELGRYY